MVKMMVMKMIKDAKCKSKEGKKERSDVVSGILTSWIKQEKETTSQVFLSTTRS